MLVHRNCPMTRKPVSMEIDVNPVQLSAWEAGELIQNVMPNLSADEREFIMTGMTPEVWEVMFGRGDG